MTQFRKGDLVECVDASQISMAMIGNTLIPSAIYTVEDVGFIPDWHPLSGIEVLFLRELKNNTAPGHRGRDAGWRRSRFRLVRRPDARFADAGQYVRTPVSA